VKEALMLHTRALPFAASLALSLTLLSPADAQHAAGPSTDIPMSDYLGLLAKIAPAARDGAEAYLQAHQRRCGRTVTAADLRRAMADGQGDPVLMGMIRASQLRDPKAINELAGRIHCGARR
jgi:hypothetical protein